jgi:hypothetical protein
MVTDLVDRLRDRAAAFNDAGLRYGVADLLNEAANEIIYLQGFEREVLRESE